eukprot:scaffold300202_cov21-Tisochrysis_lutea.AAC.1
MKDALPKIASSCPLLSDVPVDEMLRVREQLNAANKDTGAKISVNDFVIKAAALALKKSGLPPCPVQDGQAI